MTGFTVLAVAALVAAVTGWQGVLWFVVVYAVICDIALRAQKAALLRQVEDIKSDLLGRGVR